MPPLEFRCTLSRLSLRWEPCQPAHRAAGGSAAAVDELISIARSITALRSRSASDQWGLNFDGVELASKVDPQTLEFKLVSYCMALRAVSDTAVSVQTLKDVATAAEIGDELGPRGKDVVAIAGVALRRRIGTLSAQATSCDLQTNHLHHGAGLALSSSSWLRELRESLELD